jgi:uncharacterized membrane protein
VPDFGLALAVHVLAVVLWIGGVAMITTVFLPAVRRLPSGPEQLALFDAIERRFARQTRGASVVTGFYMAYRLGFRREFQIPGFWSLDAMALVWLLFTVLLFIAEPLFLHRGLEAGAAGCRTVPSPWRSGSIIGRCWC